MLLRRFLSSSPVRGKLIWAMMFLALMSIPFSTASAKGDDFADSPFGRELVNLGMKFLDNPADFFFNLHCNNEDFTPLVKDKRVGVRFNLVPTALPFTWANLNMKVKVLDENSGSRPQVDLVGMYGDMLGLKAVSGDVEPSFIDYSVGAVASKSMDEKTRLFGGVKYSVTQMDVVLSTPIVSGNFRLSSIKFQMADTFVFTGLTHTTKPRHYIAAQVGYGFKYKKIVSRIVSGHEHLELGMDIFPEGLFVFHPFIAWHWYF